MPDQVSRCMKRVGRIVVEIGDDACASSRMEKMPIGVVCPFLAAGHVGTGNEHRVAVIDLQRLEVPAVVICGGPSMVPAVGRRGEQRRPEQRGACSVLTQYAGSAELLWRS